MDSQSIIFMRRLLDRFLAVSFFLQCKVKVVFNGFSIGVDLLFNGSSRIILFLLTIIEKNVNLLISVHIGYTIFEIGFFDCVNFC